VTDNYKLITEFLETGSLDSEVRESSEYTMDDLVHIRLTLQTPNDIQKGEKFPDTAERYIHIMKVIYAMENSTITIDLNDGNLINKQRFVDEEKNTTTTLITLKNN